MASKRQREESPEEEHGQWISPLSARYASKNMTQLWSDQNKFTTWRKLWVALAQAQHEFGLPITAEQVTELKKHVYDINYEVADAKEKELRHDVMAHIAAYGEQCPLAKPIIHLGATSCFVGDNTGLIRIQQSLRIVRHYLVRLIRLLSKAALEYKDMPTLGFTHLQAAQLTTVGKRMTLWLQDFVMDVQEIQRLEEWLPFRSIVGTTGTQASFLQLFHGEQEKVVMLRKRVAELMGFEKCVHVAGQTYTRKIDAFVMFALSGIAQSAYKMGGDIRLLAHMKEIEEPFGKKQVGSSAMAYKRNPMRCERMCGIARHVMALVADAQHTHANQWLERTLDDSANRRLFLAEAFLAVDGVLATACNIVDGIHVWPNVIRAHIEAELPFMATEEILMECTSAGGDRGILHEAIRTHSMEAAKQVKMEGKPNDLLQRISKDPLFTAVHDRLSALTDPSRFVGRAPQQVEEFVKITVQDVLEQNKDVQEDGWKAGDVLV